MTEPRFEQGKGTNEDIISGYEALLERSTRMLAFACEEDWSRLLEEEAEYVIDVERLSRIEAEHTLDASFAQRKALLLERILEGDLEIRRRLSKRRDELGELLHASQRKRSVDSAYRGAAGPQVLGGPGRFKKGDA
ncbi:flagellar protein FliT [Onishia taeanensis]|uniref:Flagellar protein FliT n=1 Tax=Onishia taeanensis TaxID=284577 RepID=A0A1G7REG3_9GAMM|nr:flagellar protein FliT [Halomonas taeanensis]SDG08430.1 flagellar protein FliT [Halomonas taeanensis]